MQPEVIIVRLGEVMLKGRNRGRFVRTVHAQIADLLGAMPRIGWKQEFGRLYLELNGERYEEAARQLDKVFGIVSYSPAWKAPLDLEAIQETGLMVMKRVEPAPATFKVSSRRANKRFPLDSQQISYEVGGYILERMSGLTVDVRHPEAELRVDMRQEEVYLYTEVAAGNGGYPIGSNGRAMLMLSGGIDSPVAGWMAMRRGLEIEAVHFHSYPYTSDRAKDKVIELTKTLTQYGGPLKLHLVGFTDIQTRMLEAVRENIRITVMRRIMMRITEKLAHRRKALGIVTGENLGQVASQTLPSLHAIGQVATLPILRPLITLDKQEIIRWAEKIGTYETSILPYEDCCTIFVPKSPTTNPNMAVVERAEQAMPWLDEAIEEAVAKTETIEVYWKQRDTLDRFF
ncbi:putative tRNA sulfurtransferase [Paenibacillus sp. J31TS4]|uniref:tRNA uracil 4-sulfurtransferase ThiI n=1 Tax=Paenibacillus sp. J31TS4 TaxID=2807195 RepID=UPI001B2C4072|nr:tRNA uracil 4-sulfurtransferase ThiI [Paenibacillus sp. J31TS4]GIP39635.1 putative tRNA sulfurtransferase [Paenibacillus sp. J31TS4]